MSEFHAEIERKNREIHGVLQKVIADLRLLHGAGIVRTHTMAQARVFPKEMLAEKIDEIKAIGGTIADELRELARGVEDLVNLSEGHLLEHLQKLPAEQEKNEAPP